ncbi:polyprenyl synthetase family protein [Streptococcus pantholopis]|uniref:Farnesyl diphosphate synthase n=1 Tax=Streptococcus pantholopis TaxID=1811193 RepID=A0A172Q8G7_9STRE|nr:farnesyl diphosphate synthase [Streptococcus pantholopis]AND79722.1 geranyl transferase [Streptococcus pantholopis]
MDKILKINQTIQSYYQEGAVSPDLSQALLYSLEAGGKRIRPILLLQILEGFGLSLTVSHYQVAASVELIHTGSLVHDDLPAMDDDDYRRGQLTSHKRFDEATAILVGDSLFLDAFGLLAAADLPEKTKLSLIYELSAAAGSCGMVGGQMLDLKGEKRQLKLSELQAVHANKTGKLLAFPFVAAGLIVDAENDVQAKLAKAGSLTGLAFQVRDDILDVTADFAEIGKTPQKDLAAEKATYPSLLGLDQSYRILEETLAEVQTIFSNLEEKNGFAASQVLKTIERLKLDG